MILVDPWFNNTLEEQAFGRVHRRGQTKPIHIARIYAENTVDESIHMMKQYKASVVNYALQDDGHRPLTLQDDQIRKLLQLEKKKRQSKRGSVIDSLRL